MRGRPARVIRSKQLMDRPRLLNPNDPRSPAYAERHQQSLTDLGNGMRMVSMGEPVTAPGRTPTVLPMQPPKPEDPAVSDVNPADTPGLTPVASRDWRKDYGLGSGS